MSFYSTFITFKSVSNLVVEKVNCLNIQKIYNGITYIITQIVNNSTQYSDEQPIAGFLLNLPSIKSQLVIKTVLMSPFNVL